MSKKGSAVATLIFNRDKDSVLLVKRRDVPVWVLPGGGIDPGEIPEDAAIRETLEETKLKVSIKRKVGEFFPKNSLTRHTYLFECQIVEGSQGISDETIDIKFFKTSSLPKLLPPPYESWILLAKENLPYPVIRNIDSVSYAVAIKKTLRHPILVLRFLLSRLGKPINTK